MEPGEKIRLQREEKELSLQDVAQRAKVDEDQLLKIEEGTIDPSLGLLIKLARVLGVRLGTFLDDQEEKGPVVTRKGDNIPSFNLSASGAGLRENLSFASLASEKSDRHMDPFLVEITPESPLEGRLSSHEGEEFLFVLSGGVEVFYGQVKHVLKTGDSIYYDSIIGHRIEALGNEKALILAVVYLPL
jgi:transcriptional regulator with XRE-family HTH domain